MSRGAGHLLRSHAAQQGAYHVDLVMSRPADIMEYLNDIADLAKVKRLVLSGPHGSVMPLISFLG